MHKTLDVEDIVGIDVALDGAESDQHGNLAVAMSNFGDRIWRRNAPVSVWDKEETYQD